MTAYKPSPRPTFDGPAVIPYATVTRHLWGDKTSYRCTQVGEHRTHVYESRDVADEHDKTEARACA